MSTHPTGTVTFLFTDIEGSTSLAQQYPEALPALLARHHAIVSQAIEAHNGFVTQIIGDAFCAAFHTAPDGLRAALHAQRALQREDWSPAPVRVRMGIHTGMAQAEAVGAVAEGYIGYITLARAQRVMSTAQGQQILLSNTSAELVRGELPAGVSLLDLGEHRLKGLLNPEHIWQVVAPDLRQDFPPLPTLNAIPNNLPIQLTSFIGRDKEMAEVRRGFATTRLLTLTGVGGTGKTRLALQLGAAVLPEFRDGVWFVELASLSDPALVPQAVATALGVRQEANRAVQAALHDYLREKTLLLVLDNCEHLIQACAQFADLVLRAALKVKILATSREALDISGESIYHVPSLPSPAATHFSPETLGQFDAVKLYVDRAAAVQNEFVLTPENAPAVAQICRRLDGIPLAIELAAARTKVFAPEQIAARLDDRFRLLSVGSRNARPRHQTLSALIQWSYDLLSEAERVLLRRLSVFSGGWALEAAEAVCGDEAAGGALPPLAVLELHTSLVNKSLVVVERVAGQGARYRMLETIREYALERLVAHGESESMRRKHMVYFRRVAQEADPQFSSPARAVWVETLKADQDNFRAALQWARESGDALAGLQLAGALWLFWYALGSLSEGRGWMESALAQAVTLDAPAARAKVLLAGGNLAWFQSDYGVARALLEEGLAICRGLGAQGRRDLAYCLLWMGALERDQGDPMIARSLLQESVATCREIGDRYTLALGLVTFGRTLAEPDAIPIITSRIATRHLAQRRRL